MYTKLFYLPILCLVILSNERFSVFAGKVFLITTGYMITNQRILSTIPYENDVLIINEECGGLITQAPGTIELVFGKRNTLNSEAHCTWTLRAPLNYRIYIRDLEIIRTSAAISGYRSEDFADAPLVQVYDGPEVDETKRLFRFGNDTLSNSISSKETLTIDLYHSVSEKYAEEKILINYGFADESRIFGMQPIY